MTRSRFCAAALGLLLAASPAQAQQKSVDLDVQLKAAERREQVDGDLKGAIEQYRQIVAQSGANRTIAAKALLRMAECYQKQGDVEARKIYERLLREYPDQREAVTLAQARLGSATTAKRGASVSLRKVWTGDVLGTVSPDGRYLSFIDWTAGNLMLRDLVSGTDRALTGNPPGAWPASNDFAEESAISRDGSNVAFTWYDAANKRYELRVTSLKGQGVPPSRRLFANEEVLWIAPYDWSPDGKRIAVVLQRRDQIAQLGLVSAVDGALRVLKTVDWRGPTKVFFSPNGGFVGYDLPAAGVRQRDVFVLAVDGSREVPAVAHPANDIMMGWSLDGTQLLFASDRNGATGLWALAIQDGRVLGPAEVVQPNIGSAWSMGMTATGALYLGVSNGGQDITVASVDFSTGKRLAPPTKPIQNFMGSNRDPAWSSDGRYLAYRSTRGLSGQGRDMVIGVLDLESGETRDIVPKGLQYFNGIRWAPDGKSFAIGGTDLNARQGAFRVDAQTGVAEPISIAPLGGFVGQFPQWSPDGRRLYYRRRDDSGTTLVERELSSGNERQLLPSGARSNGLALSPDGRWISVVMVDSMTRASIGLIVPLDGGEPREVIRVNRPQSLQGNLVAWSPDGRSIIVRRQLGPEGSELLLVPINGATPLRLDVDVSELATPQISIHPDGKRLAFTAGREIRDVWVLENFLPSPKRKP